jgi:hypothetical protein
MGGKMGRKMTAAARFERNHIRLGLFHMGMAAFPFLSFAPDYRLANAWNSREMAGVLAILWAWTVLLHGSLALGAMVKLEISRKISVFVGVAMFAGAIGWQFRFPYWAFVALFLLPLTQWKAAPPPPPDGPIDLRHAGYKRGVLQTAWLGLMVLVGGGIVVTWYAQLGNPGLAAAPMVLMILFLVLAAFWPGKVQPDGPPN